MTVTREKFVRPLFIVGFAILVSLGAFSAFVWFTSGPKDNRPKSDRQKLGDLGANLGHLGDWDDTNVWRFLTNAARFPSVSVLELGQLELITNQESVRQQLNAKRLSTKHWLDPDFRFRITRTTNEGARVSFLVRVYGIGPNKLDEYGTGDDIYVGGSSQQFELLGPPGY